MALPLNQLAPFALELFFLPALTGGGRRLLLQLLLELEDLLSRVLGQFLVLLPLPLDGRQLEVQVPDLDIDWMCFCGGRSKAAWKKSVN